MDDNKVKQIKDLASKLLIATKELAFQNEEKEKRAAELIIADEELAFQSGEKAERASELIVANKELAFQTSEKADRVAELLIANKELLYQNEEKDKRAAELLIANKELSYQNEEKEKRAAELLILKDSLFNGKQLLEKTLISIGDGVISTDKNKNIIFLNKVAEVVTGWSQEEAFGKSVYDVFNIMSEFTRKREEDIVKKVMVTGKLHLLANHTILITKDGRETLIEDSAAPILDEKSKVIGVVIVFRDYTEKWERLKRIEHLSFHDEITELYNRRFYEEELKRMDTKRNLPLSLIMGDVNGLKLINDSFGHEAGDVLLRKAANAISKGCRIDDIAARLGGDEFIIVLPNTNAADSAKVIERIQSYIKMERVNGLEISISFGTETKVDMSQDINNIFKNTEDHMYRHKIYESSSMRKGTIDLITNTLFAKNGRELIHSKNVSKLAETLAEKMGFSKDDINLMRLAGLMHDIGKIGIPDKILNKDGKLTADEYAEIKKHPEIGYRILGSVNDFSEISEYVLEHHEKWDGTGYPQGLKGEEIKTEARMITICDAFDAMSTLRTYRDILSQADAINELRRCSGTQFDPEIVESFVNMIIDREKTLEN
jgi:diguanylate cyclase (GGDEF)-like protein/PAS domain S-box-containing protein/putative nucleotidyltransferase with HDIG domain